MSKEIQRVVVSENEYEVWSEDEQKFVINAPSNFYIINALGEKVFYLTRDRALAQSQANLDFDNKYTIRTVKDSKPKYKSESGEVSVRGSNTRKCFAPRLKGLK